MLVPHFIENIFRSGLTLVSLIDIITIKIDNKKVFNQVWIPSMIIILKTYYFPLWFTGYRSESLQRRSLEIMLTVPIKKRQLSVGNIFSKFKLI